MCLFASRNGVAPEHVAVLNSACVDGDDVISSRFTTLGRRTLSIPGPASLRLEKSLMKIAKEKENAKGFRSTNGFSSQFRRQVDSCTSRKDGFEKSIIQYKI